MYPKLRHLQNSFTTLKKFPMLYLSYLPSSTAKYSATFDFFFHCLYSFAFSEYNQNHSMQTSEKHTFKNSPMFFHNLIARNQVI